MYTLTMSEIDEIVDGILNGTVVGVSDGSFKDEFGTVLWILKNISGTQRIMGNVLVLGFKSDQSAYRSEVGSLYGLVMVVELSKNMWALPSFGNIGMWRDEFSTWGTGLEVQSDYE